MKNLTYKIKLFSFTSICIMFLYVMTTTAEQSQGSCLVRDIYLSSPKSSMPNAGKSTEYKNAHKFRLDLPTEEMN